jgi:hypothetical protein
VGGYSDRAGVAWNFTSRAAPVHNSYYLITAELGFIGVIGLIATMLAMIGFGLTRIRRLVPGERSDLFIGCVTATMLVTLHIAFEWLFVTAVIHYLIAMNFGLMIGIAGSQRQKVRSVVTQQPRMVPTEPVPHPG